MEGWLPDVFLYSCDFLDLIKKSYWIACIRGENKSQTHRLPLTSSETSLNNPLPELCNVAWADEQRRNMFPLSVGSVTLTLSSDCVRGAEAAALATKSIMLINKTPIFFKFFTFLAIAIINMVALYLSVQSVRHRMRKSFLVLCKSWLADRKIAAITSLLRTRKWKLF